MGAYVFFAIYIQVLHRTKMALISFFYQHVTPMG
jgi:hypothetical protein